MKVSAGILAKWINEAGLPATVGQQDLIAITDDVGVAISNSGWHACHLNPGNVQPVYAGFDIARLVEAIKDLLTTSLTAFAVSNLSSGLNAVRTHDTRGWFLTDVGALCGYLYPTASGWMVVTFDDMLAAKGQVADDGLSTHRGYFKTAPEGMRAILKNAGVATPRPKSAIFDWARYRTVNLFPC